jgi:hypothetical protein
MEVQQIMKMLIEMKADRKADGEDLLTRLEAKTDANQMKTDNNQERMDVNLKEMREDIKSGQAEMRSIVGAFQEKMDQCAASRRDDQKETVSFQETTEAHLECEEQTSVTMEFEEEHQVAPKEEAAVMPVGGLRKRRRDRNLAAGPRQEPKGRIQENSESRRRLTVAGRKRTCHARVAWRRENCVRKDWTRNQAEQEPPKQRRGMKRLWKVPECNNGLRNRGLSQQLRIGNDRTTSVIYRKAIRLKIVKRVLGISSVFRKTRKWSLWRGRPPSETKKEIADTGGAGNVGTPATPRIKTPTVGSERERTTFWTIVLEERERERKKTLDDCDNRTDWKLTRKPLGTSWP